MQEMAVPAAAAEAPSQCEGYEWVRNPVRPWDSALAMRSRWADRIVEVAHGHHWLAGTVAGLGTDRYCTVLPAHMPTSWAADIVWAEALGEVDGCFTATHRRGMPQHVILAADWNVDVDGLATEARCMRSTAHSEFLMR